MGQTMDVPTVGAVGGPHTFSHYPMPAEMPQVEFELHAFHGVRAKNATPSPEERRAHHLHRREHRGDDEASRRAPVVHELTHISST
jgi:hypothetical protein